MWTTKRREDDYPPRPASMAAPVAAEPVVREAPTPVIPPKALEPELPRGVAAIGKSVVLKGQIFSREDLYLDGELEGTVEVPEHRLTIGPHGRLQAAVKAREVVILGTIHGNVEAIEKIDIRKDARLVGDIKTSRIMIEDGAFFKGSIDIARTEAPKAAPAPPARPPAPAPAVSPVAPISSVPAANAPPIETKR